MERLSDRGGIWTKRAFPPDRVQSDIERSVRSTVIKSPRLWDLGVFCPRRAHRAPPSWTPGDHVSQAVLETHPILDLANPQQVQTGRFATQA